MQLDLIHNKTDDMSDRWWCSFFIDKKPSPSSMIPFPWFYNDMRPGSSDIPEKYMIGVILEAKSEEHAESLIELYMDVDITEVSWQRHPNNTHYSVSRVQDMFFSTCKINKSHMANFGIEPPPEPKKATKKKARKKRGR